MTVLPVRSQEELLMDYVRRLAARAAGRRAVHLRLSELRAYNRRAPHLHAATSGLRAMVETAEGQLFVLRSADTIFVYKADVHQRVEQEIQKICFLFSDDPALMDARSAADFVCRFDVQAEYERFQSVVRDLVGRAAAPASHGACQLTTKERLKRKQTAGQPLTPDLLAKLEAALRRTDLSSLVRRQTVCAVSPRLEVETRFVELYVAIAELRETLLPNVNLLGNRWLFQHLTETLDRRVLQLLTMPENAVAGDLSINLNLNVATLLSKDFGTFDNALSAHRAGALIVELQAIDVFQDLRAFHLARKALQDKGYRVCLDGVGYRDLELIDCDRLGVDLVKMLWDADLLIEADPMLERLRLLIARAGPSRLVLCRVDSRVGIDLGHALGIAMFQGRCVEELLTNDNRRRHLLRLKQVLSTDT